VQFELTDPTRESVAAWITYAKLRSAGFFVPKPSASGTPPDDAPARAPGQPLGGDGRA
jgi:hypothetical protein